MNIITPTCSSLFFVAGGGWAGGRRATVSCGSWLGGRGGVVTETEKQEKREGAKWPSRGSNTPLLMFLKESIRGNYSVVDIAI